MRSQTTLNSPAAKDTQALCRFYTREPVGAALIAFLGAGEPRRAIDLGSGPGCLSSAIGNRWSGCEIVTVDIDSSVRSAIGGSSGGHRHIVMDVLHPDLPEVAIAGGEGFDLTVSNPPYGLHYPRAGSREILLAAGLDEVGDVRAISPWAEVLFLGQSIRLARTGGRIGLIVPDSIVTGKAAAGLRRTLAERHRIERVVQLPRGSFQRTETQAFLLVLRKDARRCGSILLQTLSQAGAAWTTIEVDPQVAEHRLDHRYHAAMAACAPRRSTLADLGTTVVRGRRRGGAPDAFHTTDFPSGANPRSVAFAGAATDDPTLAGPGDILVARIGRGLERKVCIVREGWTPLTDCVYRLRVPEPHRDRVFSLLTSGLGEELLAGSARGTGALMLGKGELLDLPVPT